MTTLGILKLISMLMLVMGINMHFKDQQSRRNFKNLYPEVLKYDSLTIDRVDSLLITYRK